MSECKERDLHAVKTASKSKHLGKLRRAMVRWHKYGVNVLDEVGYVPLADVGAQIFFQIISERLARSSRLIPSVPLRRPPAPILR